MSTPIKRIRIVRDSKGYLHPDQDKDFDLSWWNDAFPEYAPHTECFYILEDREMLERLVNAAVDNINLLFEGKQALDSDKLVEQFLKSEEARG